MSFRRSKAEARAERRWDDFCRDNAQLIQAIGLPMTVTGTFERFTEFLMEGHLWHHDDPTEFTVSELRGERYELFKQLVERYFAAGYCNPGLGVLSHEERLALARKYPRQFRSTSDRDDDHRA